MISTLALIATLAQSIEMEDAKASARLFGKEAKVEKLAGGMQFTEGPVWVAKEKKLIFSDIPANELKVWTKAKGVET
ncbi:MAG: SMP-30/gluconolactonase/LRE family protein, partial [Acidobacteriota bacterium]